MKHIYILLFFQLIGINLIAQNLGGHPSDIKWKHIISENVNLIYPEDLKSSAERILNTIDYINSNNTLSVGNKSKKIDIVLHTNQVISNGFVGLAPYKSEFFGIGMQNMNRLGSVDWLDALSVHEYRHSLQFANSRRGFSNIMSYLFGQAGWAGAMMLSIPSWYFEGDAVLTETLLTEAGRGRTPSFYKELRANILSSKNYSYMVARNGSYNKMLPNIYPMGFAICNYTRNQYGDNVWGKILADAGSYRTIVYPFSGAMKRHTGVRTHKMYKKAFEQLKTDWERELDTIQLSTLTKISKANKRTVTNYQFAQVMNDGSVVAVKSSYKETPYIVKIKEGVESKICSYGISQDIYLSANNNILTWTEFEKDLRRSNRNYNKIISYDYNNNKKKVVCSHTKYFSPHASSDGSKIVVINISEKLKNNIVIIDSKTGAEIKRLTNPTNDFLSFPKWTKDDKDIVYIAKRKSKLALIKINIETQQTTELTDWSSHVIGSTSVVNNKVYFSSSYSGIDNIYAVYLDGKKQIKQLTSVPVGVYQPTISDSNNKLIMSQFTSMGYEIAELQLKKDIEDYSNINIIEPIEQARYRIKTNENEHNILNKVPEINHFEQAYKGFFKGIKFHSWFFTLDNNKADFSLLMNNSLNNLAGIFSVIYNYNEETLGFNANMVYAKWFAEILVGINSRERQIILANKFNEASLSLGANIPLSWTNGKYAMQLNTEASINHYRWFNLGDITLKSSNFTNIFSHIDFSAIQTMAYQNIQPRLGVKLKANFYNSISQLTANKIYAETIFFLPSFVANHGFKIGASWQQEDTGNNYIFENTFIYSRGYSATINDNIYKLSLDYSMPLFYPNWGFWGLTYFKRVRTNMFYDYSQAEYKHNSFNMNSCGIALIFDNTFLNVVPMSIGFRTSFLLNTDRQNPNREIWHNVFFSINF